MALLNIKQVKGATQGSVLFLGSNGVVTENNSKLYWDNTNYKLGVGTQSGTNHLYVYSSAGVSGYDLIRVQNSVSTFVVNDDGYASYTGNNGFRVIGSNGRINVISAGGIEPSINWYYNSGSTIQGSLYGQNNSMLFTMPSFTSGLGIGTDLYTPSAILNVRGVTSGTAFKVQSYIGEEIFDVKNSGYVSIGTSSNNSVIFQVNDRLAPSSTRKIVNVIDSLGSELMSLSRNTFSMSTSNQRMYSLSGVLDIQYTMGQGTMTWYNTTYGSETLRLNLDASPIFSSTFQNSIRFDSLVGIGMTGVNLPSTKLHINATQSGAFRLVDTTQAAGYVLTSDANGVGTWQPASGGGGVTGSGTTNYLARWTTSTQLGTGSVYDDGTNVGIGTVSTTTKLTIQGTGTLLDFYNPNYDNIGTKVDLLGNVYVQGATGSYTILQLNHISDTRLIIDSDTTASFTLKRSNSDRYTLLSTNVNDVREYTYVPYITFLNSYHRIMGTSGGEVAYFDATNQRVGIGTINPSTKLQVVGGSLQGVYSTSTNDIAINGVGSGASSFGVKGESDLGTALRSNITNSSGIGLEINYTPTNSPLLKVLGTGEVGVNISNPSTKLHIFATQSGAFRLQDTTQGSGRVLTSDANGVGTWQSVGTASGLGTVNKYSTTILNSSISISTPITVTHSLTSTDITVTAWDVSLNELTYPKFSNRTTNTVDVTFTSIPSGDIRVVITS